MGWMLRGRLILRSRITAYLTVVTPSFNSPPPFVVILNPPETTARRSSFSCDEWKEERACTRVLQFEGWGRQVGSEASARS